MTSWALLNPSPRSTGSPTRSRMVKSRVDLEVGPLVKRRKKGVSRNGGTPIAGCFIKENPINQNG